MAYKQTAWEFSEEVEKPEEYELPEEGLRNLYIKDAKYDDETDPRGKYTITFTDIGGEHNIDFRVNYRLFTFDKNTNVRKPNNRARGTLISLNKALFDSDVGIPYPGDIIGGVVVGEVEHMSFTGNDGKARTIATVRRFDPVGPDMTVFSEIDQYYIGREDEEE